MTLIDQRIRLELSKRRQQNALRNLSLIDTNLLDFYSNDYLGFSRNSDLIEDVKISYQSVQNQYLGSGGSRLLAGNYKEYEELENDVAKVHNAEAALVFNSGYSANQAVFSTLPNKRDLVLYDEQIHACIKEGARASNAKFQSFRHNDLKDLAQKLDCSSFENIFVAVESLYSMDGDFAPLESLTELCQNKGAHLVVDEAHSTGVFGCLGAGLVSELKLDEFIFLKIHTFGKAVGVHGGAVLSSQLIKDYLVNFSRQFIYTTSLPLHTIVSLQQSYSYLKKTKSLQRELEMRTTLFNKVCHHVSSAANSPIQSVIIEGNDQVKNVAQSLRAQGFGVKEVLSPTVKVGKERLRICIHLHNSLEDVESLATSVNALMN